MQLNIYIPRDREAILKRLDRASRRTGKPKSELVLDAVEAYIAGLERDDPTSHPAFRTFDLGAGDVPTRADLYESGRPT